MFFLQLDLEDNITWLYHKNGPKTAASIQYTPSLGLLMSIIATRQYESVLFHHLTRYHYHPTPALEFIFQPMTINYCLLSIGILFQHYPNFQRYFLLK